MKRFPGRTLEELDGVDWFRLMRALEVENIHAAEDARALLLQKKLKPDQIPPVQWEMIREHDRLLADD